MILIVAVIAFGVLRWVTFWGPMKKNMDAFFENERELHRLLRAEREAKK